MANINPYAQSEHDDKLPAEKFTGKMTTYRARLYMLQMLNYDQNTPITNEALREEFDAIIKHKGI